MERVCVYCGKSFATNSNAQCFCSGIVSLETII